MFVNLLNIVGDMMDKNKVITDDIKTVTEEFQKFIEDHICLNSDCCNRQCGSCNI